MVSETIKDMADTYEETTNETNNTIKEIYDKNRKAFISELLNNLDGLEENIKSSILVQIKLCVCLI